MAGSGAINGEWSPFRCGSRRKRFGWHDLLFFTILVLSICFFIYRASKLPEYSWNWHLLCEFIIKKNATGQWESGLLLKGLYATLRVGIWSIVFSLVLGGILGIISARKSFLTTFLCQIYVNLFRNTPPLVILFAVYFFAGNLLPTGPLEDAVRLLPEGWRDLAAAVFAGPGQMDRMIAAVLALGMYQSAYVAEILRGGIASVDRGQWDAAKALGFNRWQCVYLVILPQACRLIIPPLTGQTISSFKDSTLASLISIPDMTFQSLEIMAISGMTFEIWLTTGILYLLIGAWCGLAGSWLERRASKF